MNDLRYWHTDRMNTRGTIALTALALFAGLGLAGCTGGGGPVGTLESTAEPTAEPTAQAPAEADGTSANPYEFGDLALTNATSQWNVTLSEPDIAGAVTVAGENEFNAPPAAGSEYVLGRITAIVNDNITAENTGKEASAPQSATPAFVGSDGKIYDLFSGTFVVINEDWLSVPTIINNVGVESTGRFAIEVPIEAITGGQFAIRNAISGDIIYFGPKQ